MSSHRPTSINEETHQPDALADGESPVRQRYYHVVGSSPARTVPNRHLAAHGFGTEYLTWRCAECGETGPFGALPERCVVYSVGREALYCAIEDYEPESCPSAATLRATEVALFVSSEPRSDRDVLLAPRSPTL